MRQCTHGKLLRIYVVMYMCNFYRQLLVLRNPLPFFSGRKKTENLQWGLCIGFFFTVFSALTLLVAQQEGHPVYEKLSGGLVGCWHGYVSGSWCRFAYGPADATVTHYLLLQQIQIGFTFLVLPFWCRLTRVVPDKIQRAVKWLCAFLCVCVRLLFFFPRLISEIS